MKADAGNAPVTATAEELLSAAEILAKVRQHEADHAAAAAEASTLRDATAGMLLRSSNQDMEQHDAAIRAADRKAERALQFIELLKPELEAARYREDQERRRATYEAALAAHAELEILELVEYPKLAAAMAKLLARVCEIDAQVKAANDYRPHSDSTNKFLPLIRFEGFRGRKGKGEWSETITEIYYVDRYGMESRPPFYIKDGERTYDKREYTEKTREKVIRHSDPDQFKHTRLTLEVSLPGAKLNDADFWPPKPAR